LNYPLSKPFLLACGLGLLSLQAQAVEMSAANTQSGNALRSQVPQSAWLNKPAKLDWTVNLSAQATDKAQFYDLSLAVPLFDDFNQVNDLNLLFINRLVYGQMDDPYQTWDGTEYDDYLAFETAFRMNVPFYQHFHVFVEAGLDSGRLVFGEVLGLGTSDSRRYNSDYKVDYSASVGLGYSQLNYGVNLIFRQRNLHFNQDYQQNMLGLELVYGF